MAFAAAVPSFGGNYAGILRPSERRADAGRFFPISSAWYARHNEESHKDVALARQANATPYNLGVTFLGEMGRNFAASIAPATTAKTVLAAAIKMRKDLPKSSKLVLAKLAGVDLDVDDDEDEGIGRLRVRSSTLAGSGGSPFGHRRHDRAVAQAPRSGILPGTPHGGGWLRRKGDGPSFGG